MSQARSNARKSAVQALYQWQMTGQNFSEIESQFALEERLKNAQRSYFVDLFHGVPKHLDEIDKAMAEYIDRPIEQVDPVERAVLRVSVYELLIKMNVPCRVIINEGINLAKCFGAEGSHKFVNSVLDKVAQKSRQSEMQSPKTN